MKKIVFVTGTRADYGKLKALMKQVENSDEFDNYIYVSGMHLQKEYGGTYEEILKDGYKHIHVAFGLISSRDMSYNLGDVICNFTGYVKHICPDMIVVHGDRIDALAGAIVGALNNILVAHIEGGELSGTIDESIRHAISKLAHIHLVSNEDAKHRLIQLGEEEQRIYILGSPDIDIMYSEELPTLQEVCGRYDIGFAKYGILMYHPVTTEYKQISSNIGNIVSALKKTAYNFVVIYPNNDLGSELILREYEGLIDRSKFRVFSSIRFEYFLTLLRYAEFMIGNSSAGIRETCIYGIPSIDIGSRQHGRYDTRVSTNIQHVEAVETEILRAIGQIENYRKNNSVFGSGNSAEIFMNILHDSKIWKIKMQKHFVDMIF
ncbi:MAG: UDP-N-acetylglucosamine 2-epimerase [Ruminococcus flavefaciens]|nr:UDP-N-acetylglucosamine 2-epimerase [Ruminococcus flavefaciens]